MSEQLDRLLARLDEAVADFEAEGVALNEVTPGDDVDLDDAVTGLAELAQLIAIARRPEPPRVWLISTDPYEGVIESAWTTAEGAQARADAINATELETSSWRARIITLGLDTIG